jgi:uncharacterized membrane protein YjfL (UPF0719 family)
MPSVSRIEEMQDIVTWGGGIAQVLGFVCVVAVLTSLRQTAQYLEWEEGEERARTALHLCIFAALFGIGLGVIVSVGVHGALPLIVMGALALLVLGIVFLVAFVRLALDLARRMDEHVERDEPGDHVSDEPLMF